MSRKYDAIVIGAGQAGPFLAARFAGAGKSVAIIERHLLGGTCVNAGCTPTKTLIASARIAYDARRARDYGIELADPGVTVNMRAVHARKERVVGASRSGLENWLRGMQNCSLYKGHASFESARSVSVGGEILTSAQIFINVGGRPRNPALAGSDGVPFLTSTSLLELEDLPPHLIIVGGSYVGLEFAQMYRRFGSDVTIIEKEPRLLPREDVEVAAAIQGVLEAEGIQIRLGARMYTTGPPERVGHRKRELRRGSSASHRLSRTHGGRADAQHRRLEPRQGRRGDRSRRIHQCG